MPVACKLVKGDGHVQFRLLVPHAMIVLGLLSYLNVIDGRARDISFLNLAAKAV